MLHAHAADQQTAAHGAEGPAAWLLLRGGAWHPGLCLGMKLSVSHEGLTVSSSRAGAGSGCRDPKRTLSWCLLPHWGFPGREGDLVLKATLPLPLLPTPVWDVLSLTPLLGIPQGQGVSQQHVNLGSCQIRGQAVGQVGMGVVKRVGRPLPGA